MDGGTAILVVDDDPSIHRLFRDLVAAQGEIRILEARSGEAALQLLQSGETVDVAIVDRKMPGMDGLELLREIRRVRPDCSVVMLTGDPSIESAVEAMKRGAADYLQKPFRLPQLQIILDRVRNLHRLEEENRRLREELGEKFHASGLVGRSPSLQKVHSLIGRLRNESCTVLIRGESGTGKELVARAIHYDGARSRRAFVAFDCASLPGSLLESELFGHEKGAFTGATRARSGLFEKANGGTIFFDEIGEMPVELQPALLRVVQERRIRPVGGTEDREVDVRIVAATNRDLEEEIRAGRFRRDLFYRLNVVGIVLPPLRERREDIPLLVEHLLQSRPGRSFSPDAMRVLLEYGWPGNVRELRNVVERALLLSDSPEIGPEGLPMSAEDGEAAGSGLLRQLEVREIRRLLELHGGNLSVVSGILGIHRSTLYRKLERDGIVRGKGLRRPRKRQG